MISPSPDEIVVDIEGSLVIPGLINGHFHSYGGLTRATIPALPLELWALHATADTVNRSHREGYLSAALSAMELIRSGVTSVIDHLAGSRESIEGALRAYRDFGMRVAVAPMISDLRPHQTYPSAYEIPTELAQRLMQIDAPTLEESTKLTEDLMIAHHDPGGLVQVFAGPSGPQRSSQDLLEASAELARKFETGFHTHLLESPVQSLGDREDHGLSLVERLHRSGALNSGFSGAHSVWTRPGDLHLLADNGATVVNNPASNLYLGNGIAPFREWAAAGLHTAIGTDGANCGGNLRVMESIRLQSLLQHIVVRDPGSWVTGANVLTSSYRGGSHAMMLDHQIGKIAEGYDADLVIVDATLPCYASAGDLVEILVSSFESSHVTDVLIRGEFVLRDQQLTTVDEASIISEAVDAAEAVASRNSEVRSGGDAQHEALVNLYLNATATFPPIPMRGEVASR